MTFTGKAYGVNTVAQRVQRKEKKPSKNWALKGDSDKLTLTRSQGVKNVSQEMENPQAIGDIQTIKDKAGKLEKDYYRIHNSLRTMNTECSSRTESESIQFLHH